jgi:hypothetical protein
MIVTSATQAFRDQVEAQLADDTITMMYILSPIPDDDNDFQQVVEAAQNRVKDYKQ